jgi:hypothetical protein
MSTLAVVEEILRETGVPMSVREIVERAGSRLPSKSKTPDTVVARDLSMNLKRLGETSIFIRTSPGRYSLRELAAAAVTPPAIAATITGAVTATVTGAGGIVGPTEAELAASTTSVLSPLRGERAAPMPTLPARKPAAVGDLEAEGGGFAN